MNPGFRTSSRRTRSAARASAEPPRAEAEAVGRRWALRRHVAGHHQRVRAMAQHEALRVAGAVQHVEEIEVPGAVQQRLGAGSAEFPHGVESRRAILAPAAGLPVQHAFAHIDRAARGGGSSATARRTAATTAPRIRCPRPPSHAASRTIASASKGSSSSAHMPVVRQGAAMGC